MNPQLFVTFCLAATVLILMPGPIVTLVVANSLSHGSRTGLTTVAGASLGHAMLLAAGAAGLMTFFAFLGEVFTIVRWAGAAYLIWLGVKAWRAHAASAPGPVAPLTSPSPRALFIQGFLIAMTNPKAIFFYIAFLPQFIDPRLPPGPQLAAMSGAMIAIGLVSDSSYALLAGRLRGWFVAPGRRRLQGRIIGTLLIGTGCGLLLARRGS
ncbi:MAG: LysE family translocator [Rhodospirillales bacterium]|nr:LysE family translocator [Rhodospirillales bacterium]